MSESTIRAENTQDKPRAFCKSSLWKWKSLSHVKTLCDPMDYTVRRVLQARILEWVAFPFSGDLPNPGIKHRSPTLQVDSLPAEPPGKPPECKEVLKKQNRIEPKQKKGGWKEKKPYIVEHLERKIESHWIITQSIK